MRACGDEVEEGAPLAVAHALQLVDEQLVDLCVVRGRVRGRVRVRVRLQLVDEQLVDL